MKLAPAVRTQPQIPWPPQPYKGLNYYGPEDMPIFAGRELDIDLCARLLSSPATRILILHGSTGCGKSSFLRAGLIPFLERNVQGYSFARTDDSNELKAHFVRSTDDPLCRLAEAVFGLAQQPITRSTPVGLSQLDLSPCVKKGTSNREEFVKLVIASPGSLVDSLTCIARKLPETLVLVIDQVEEALTLRPGQGGEGSRTRFFVFLEQFMDIAIDLKIILAIRTEFFGRLIYELRHSIDYSSRIPDYFLMDLSEEQLVRAIVLPTSDQPVGNFSIPQEPRKHYHFMFAPGLPETIATDLRNAVPAGGILPVMQLVCGRLYKSVHPESATNIAEITDDNYYELGGVEGQLEGHVTETLFKMCELAKLDKDGSIRESKKWDNVLSTLAKKHWRKAKLAKSQVDGTVTTDLMAIYEFEGEVEKARCRIPVGEACKLLIRDEYRLLRPVTVYNAQRRIEIHCLALGHDAIGLVLKNWIRTSRSLRGGPRATRASEKKGSY